MRICRPLRLRTLRARQKMKQIDVQGLEHVRELLKRNTGILITPNHSFHYDAFVLFEAAHRLGTPFYTMTAWQVFAMSNLLERWWMQKHGCFSINREANDMQALRQAVRILQNEPHPLVIFPEGDIYHTNDRVTPFREGAAAIALTAARKSDRPIIWVPCAMKCWYIKDPTPKLLRLMDRLEQSLLWRPRHDLSLVDRVYRLADGLLSLKELEYLGHSRPGRVPERCLFLADAILCRQEKFYSVRPASSKIPERVKELRRVLIERLEKRDQDPNDRFQAQSDMEDLFLVIQLYSYPGNYVRERVSIERLAETLDKLEEDVFRTDYPGVRGTRRVVVRFGAPVELPQGRQSKSAIPEWTDRMQQGVQSVLDELNRESEH